MEIDTGTLYVFDEVSSEWKQLGGGEDDSGNLFDISTLSGVSGITVNGKTFVGTANAISAAGPLALKETIPSKSKVVISCTVSNNQAHGNTGIGAILYFSDYNKNNYSTELKLDNTITTPTRIETTYTATTALYNCRIQVNVYANNAWTVSNLKIKIVEE